MPEQARASAGSRNPNMCASCSSLADGMEDIVVRHQGDAPGIISPNVPAVLPETLEAAPPPAPGCCSDAVTKHAA